MSYKVKMSTVGARKIQEVDSWEAGLAQVAQLLDAVKAKGYQVIWCGRQDGHPTAAALRHPKTGQSVSISVVSE